MSRSERPDPLAGPLETMGQAYFAGLDRLAKSNEPAVKAVSLVNLEVMVLASRRTRAWLDIPASLGHCRTVPDLLGAQTRFWQTAVAQYTESWQRTAAALASCAAFPGFAGMPEHKATAAGRDIITFPDAPETGEPTETKRDRRAA